MEIFNDAHFASTNASHVFHPFPRLPPELRACIWLLALSRYRFVPLVVRSEDDDDGDDGDDDGDDGDERATQYTSKNSLGNIISGADYTVSIRDYRSSLSHLLRVSSEARSAALRFYRVRLPVRLRRGGTAWCYVNPDYDVLALVPYFSQFPPVKPNLLVHFLHDVKAYDPKGTGVVHLELTSNGPHLFREYTNWFTLEARSPFKPLHPTSAASLADILRRTLKSVFCTVDFLGSDRMSMPLVTSKNLASHLGRGYPLRRYFSSVTHLDWLPRDPRPVGADLRLLQFHHDPRTLYYEWRRDFEEAILGPEGGGGVDFFICPAVHWKISDRDDDDDDDDDDARRARERREREMLKTFLANEGQVWDEVRERYSRLCGWDIPRHGDLLDEATFQRLETELQSAVGMWVFRPEAFGEAVDDENQERIYSNFKGRFDGSAAWPGLMAFEDRPV